MTDIDKKRFDEILHSDKLYAYIVGEVPDIDVKECIHLAYWWGVLSAHKRPLTNKDVTKLIMGWDIP